MIPNELGKNNVKTFVNLNLVSTTIRQSFPNPQNFPWLPMETRLSLSVFPNTPLPLADFIASPDCPFTASPDMISHEHPFHPKKKKNPTSQHNTSLYTSKAYFMLPLFTEHTFRPSNF